MSTQEIVVDQTPVTLAPIDPAVVIPEHVRRASAAADELHNRVYHKEPEATPEPAPVVEVAPEPVQEAAPVVEAPSVQPQQTSDYPAPTRQELQDSDWAARYNSMKGRYEASQRTIGSMQEQMSQLGDELMRTQQLLRGQAPEQQTTQHSNNKLITAEDEQAYGPELIDLARRAAAEQLGPEIDALRNENQSLKQRVTVTAQGEVKNTLAAQVPDWQAINKSTEFKNWLRLRNVYTGQVRQQMLNEAYSAADAPKVVAFFKDFLREGVATGQVAPAAQLEQPIPAPRTAAIALDALAAPGRARPASGEFSAPADKPIFTRAQISKFYADVRRGAYNGRETLKATHEQSIFSAQQEGRVR